MVHLFCCYQVVFSLAVYFVIDKRIMLMKTCDFCTIVFHLIVNKFAEQSSGFSVVTHRTLYQAECGYVCFVI